MTLVTEVGRASDFTFVESWDTELCSANPLAFPGYQPPSSANESVRTGLVDLGGVRVVGIECDFEANGGTMGAVAGERITRAYERAAELNLHVAAIVASGGARLQEGMVSLTQMTRTVSAVASHRSRGLMTAAVFRPHTTGGVYVSWASLADFRAAEPGATIGFGGPRVVQQVTGTLPPPTSHTAESAFRNGHVDALVTRSEQLDWLARVLSHDSALPLQLGEGRMPAGPSEVVASSPWDRLTAARSLTRPSGLEWAAALTSGWRELRGKSRIVRAGLADLAGVRTIVIATDRHAWPDSAARPGPDDYRLAQRAIALAGRLAVGVVLLVDMPGAEPGPEAEADGIAGEIARTLLALAEVDVATVSVCVGEGGSGGAIAFAHTDRFITLSGAVFSVIGPEAGAVILHRDASRAPELATSLRMVSEDLMTMGVVDEVVDESAPDVVSELRRRIVEGLESKNRGSRNSRPRELTARALI